MGSDIKPIETRYKGYRFRSRLEARWAVFFDAIGIKWEYEAEGFDLGRFGWYLPDFYLPDWKSWIEIKPTLPSEDEFAKFAAFIHMNNYRNGNAIQESHMLCGSPGIPNFSIHEDGSWELLDGYVALCPIVIRRFVTFDGIELNGIKRAAGGGLFPVEKGELGDEDSEIVCAVEAFALTQGGKNLDIWPVYSLDVRESESDSVSVLLDTHRIKHSVFFSLQYPRGFVRRYYSGDGVVYDSMPLRMAYTAARGARFEHGETPA